MKTKPIAIVIIIFCTLISSCAQILYKIGSMNLSFDLLKLLTNIPIMIGLFIYFISALMMTYALKKGQLSILYPFLALTYIWVSLLSTRYLPVPEEMNSYKWIGITIIIAGVTLIGIGSQAEAGTPEEKQERKGIS
jgi:drug/metabolite transporter (DMT)-like permease